MSFFETIESARAFLARNGRVSLRVLKREFALDDEALDELVEELVDVQQVAAREGKVLSWIGAGPTEASAPVPETRATPEASSEPVEGPPAAEAERRHLTVLFCDLADSTELASRLDAEDWRDVVRAYQESASSVIERYEGHIAQYLGDGVLVYFGWPRAHEDDPERAVRAGLGIVEAVGAGNDALEERHDLRLALRVGIHTGPVVVGEMGGGARRETLAMGDTTNVAARLEGIAGSNTVVLSTATLRLVSGIFLTHDLGEHALKGVGAVHVHQAVRPSGMRSRLDLAAATGLTPLVSRDQELMLLEDRVAQVAEGRGQGVLISGEAGIGKSRLAAAFRERLAARAYTWLEGRCSPYTQDSVLYPVLELQRQALGFRAEEPVEVRTQRLEQGLLSAGFNLARAMPLMASFHGLALRDRYEDPVLSPEGRRKRTLEMLSEWLLRLGREQPVVLLMEDLHWADPSTQELLGQVLEQLATVSVLLLATHRPDFQPPWVARSHVTPLLLSRLTRAQIADLVRKVARGQDLPDAWVEEIVGRSDGVPLFAEELTKTVLQSNRAEGLPSERHIPETLQDALMARLDQLGPVKELAQLGSVLGREFGYELLVAVSPTPEAELQEVLAAAVREELFYQRGTPPDATYLFKHALIQDAAYQSLLRSTRQRHHRRVAETLIERLPAIAEAQPEVVAHHLTEGVSTETAITWWQRAGEHAAEHSANAEAAGHFGKALRLLAELPEGRARDERELELRLALGAPLGAVRSYGDPEVQHGYARARELCARIGESPRLGAALWGLGHVKFNQGELLDAHELAEELMRHAQHSGDRDLVLEAHHLLWATSLWKGELRNAEAHISEGISLYRPDRHRALKFLYGAHDPGVCCYGLASLTQWALGRPEQALESSLQSIALAEELAHPFTLCYAHVYAAILHLLRREEARAGECGDVLLALGREQGFPRFVSTGALLRAYAAASTAPTRDLVEEMKLTLAQLAGGGERVGATLMLSALAEAQVRLGDVEEGLQGIAGALAMANEFGERLAEAEIHRRKGEALLMRNESADAIACFERALEVAKAQQARSFELRAATSLARLWLSQGRKAEARDLLAPIYDWFTEGFDTHDLKDAKAVLEEVE